MPRIDRFMAEGDVSPDQRGELLRELVAIDMEYRWRRNDAGNACGPGETAMATAAEADTDPNGFEHGPTLENYLLEWPELSRNGSPPTELIAEEYRIRQRWGDRPDAEEYLNRFGDCPTLRETLNAVQLELLLDEIRGSEADAPLGHTGFDGPRDALGSEASEPRTFGRYRLLERLGRGGMGEVWLAEDTHLERRVALKMPRMDDVAPQLRERFILEAKAAANLRHPGICPVFDAGEIEGQPFLTMAFIEGETLAARIRRDEGSSPTAFILVLSQIARAMQAAHEAGIVHRDLKPSNIMVDAADNTVVMDFGLAYRATAAEGSERLTQSGDTLGSPSYMSPEQVEGRLSDIGPTTDIYSLGVMLYEGLAGRLPFTGTPSAIMIRIARDEPPALSALTCDVDRELEQLCLAMLAKDPARRPGSMGEVAERLTAIGHRFTSAARSAATDEKPSGRLRRTLLAVVGVAALVLMLGAVQYIIQTPFGRVSIEIDPAVADDIRVRVLRDGRVVTIADATSGWTIELKEGEYQFEPGTADVAFTISPKTVRISRRETELVKVVVDATRPEAHRDAVSPSLPETPASPEPPDLALQFDGVDDHVITPVVYDGSHPLTVEAWIAAADPWENGLAISNRDATGFTLGQYVHDRNPVWQALVFDRTSSSAALDLFSQIDRTARYHLALVWDGGTCRMFVNGNQRGWHSAPLTEMPASDRPILLGSKWNGPNIDRRERQLFAGVIDEIRISRTARYDQPFSPVSRFASDEDTLALYHCDEADGNVLRDASGLGNDATVHGATRVAATRLHAPGRYYEQLERFLAGVARPMPAREGAALEFLRGDARVEIPPIDLDFMDPFTVEVWATPDADYQTFSRGRYLLKLPGVSLKIDWPANLWTLVAWSPSQSAAVSAVWDRTANLGRRTHVAFQWNGEHLQLFLNGRLCPGRELARGTFDRLGPFLRKQVAMSRSTPLILGNHPTDKWDLVHDKSHAFGGTIDAFRLSRGARYQDDFEPETLAPDEATEVLYDFAEGEGEVLHDRSGNGHDAKIIAARWRPAPPDTPPLPGLVAQPAEIDGVRRWQIDTRWPRAQLCVQRYSPDGKSYAIGSEDGSLRILADGPRGCLQGLCHIADSSRTFAFDWAPGSQRFVTSDGGMIQTWNLHGEPLHQWVGDVEAVAWSPSGEWIAGSSRRGVVHLWRPDGTPGPTLRLWTPGAHSGLSWSPDGEQLVAFSGATVVIGTTEGEFVRTLAVESSVRHVEWNPTGGRITVVTRDGSIEVWEPSGRRLRQSRYEHRGPQSWGWSPDGQFFAVATKEQCALWDRDGRLVWDVPSRQIHSHQNDVLTWSPDSERILVAKTDRSVLVHRARDGSVTDRIGEEVPRISSVAWSDRRKLWTASAFADRPLRLFDADGMPQGPFLPEKYYSYDVAWDAAGESVLFADGGSIRRLPVSPEAELRWNTELLASESAYRLIAKHPTDDLIATASYGGLRSIIDGQGRKVVGEHASTLNDLAFSPDGKWVGGTDGSSVILWDGETVDWRQRVVATDKTYGGIAWATDSRRIATVANRNAVEVFDLDGRLLNTLEVHPVANVSGDALAWGPDDRWITWSRRSLDYAVQAVELETRRALEFDRHVAHVADATWIAPDQILTVGEDGLLAVWDVSRGACLWTMVYRHEDDEHRGLQAITFTPQGAIRHADAEAVEALLYIVEREPGHLEVFTKNSFEKEFLAAANLADN